VRLRKTLVDERTAWQQRIHALLFHHGVQRPRALLTREGRAALAKLELSASAREALTVALAMIDACEVQLAPLDRDLVRYARRQSGCLALMRVSARTASSAIATTMPRLNAFSSTGRRLPS
jgi:transposase